MLEVLGEGGANLLHNGEQVQIILYKNGSEPEPFTFEENGDSRWQSNVNYYNQAHCNQIEDFIEAIISGREPIYGGSDGLRAVNVALASIVSANNNKPVLVSEV
jgi:predicted dehydrogenase